MIIENLFILVKCYYLIQLIVFTWMYNISSNKINNFVLYTLDLQNVDDEVGKYDFYYKIITIKVLIANIKCNLSAY